MKKEDEDECNDCNASAVIAGVGKYSATSRQDNERRKHAHTGPDEECPTTKTVDQKSCHDGRRKVEELEESVDQCLGVWISDANSIEDESEVVGYNSNALPESVELYHPCDGTAYIPLRKSTYTDTNQCSLAVAGSRK